MPVGHTATMSIDMASVFNKNLSVFGSRGMPPWRYGQLLSLIESGAVDMSPMIGREIALSGLSDELAAFNGPTPPGVAVITDFSR